MCCPIKHPNTWKRQQETWGKPYFLVTEILLPVSWEAKHWPVIIPDAEHQAAAICKPGFSIRCFNEEVSASCTEGFGIWTLTGVACVRRTCELMTLFITHLIITHSLMPQPATNSLNKFLLLEIKLLCFSCDQLEECCCCYCLFFKCKQPFSKEGSMTAWCNSAPSLGLDTKIFMLKLINEQWTNYMLESPPLFYFWSLILECYNCFEAPCVHITNAYVTTEM